MEENAKLIQTLLESIKQSGLPSYGSWANELANAKSQEHAVILLGVGLHPRCVWRIRAVNFLLDLMNTSDYGVGIQVESRCDERQPLSVLKCKAADAIIFNYLKDDPESKGVEWCRWSQDFEECPELFGKLLRTLHAHRFDSYMSSGDHPESVIKRFLKRCSTAYLWKDRKFEEVKNLYLVDLYVALLGLNMSDLIKRCDDVSLEALKTIVLGGKEDRPKTEELMKKRIQEALIMGSSQDAAMCLVVMTAMRVALDLEREKERVDRELRELESKRRQLTGAP